MLQKSYLDFRTGVRVSPTSDKTDALGKSLPKCAKLGEKSPITWDDKWTQQEYLDSVDKPRWEKYIWPQEYLDNKKKVNEFYSVFDYYFE